eukprot:2642-Heterococcus_DN1.PRE.6
MAELFKVLEQLTAISQTKRRACAHTQVSFAAHYAALSTEPEQHVRRSIPVTCSMHNEAALHNELNALVNHLYVPRVQCSQ